MARKKKSEVELESSAEEKEIEAPQDEAKAESSDFEEHKKFHKFHKGE